MVLKVPVAGVTLLAVIALIGVQGILMGQAAETWTSLVQHDLEDELLFRGEEIKRGIEAYQRDNAGRLPMKLEDLVGKEKDSKKYIRREWKDPITGRDFRLLGPGEAGRRKAENEARRQQEELDPLLGGFGSRDRSPRGELSDGGPRLSEFEYGLPGRESKIETTGERPIQGVASDSHDKAFRTYQQSEYYDEWEFVAEAYRTQRLNPPRNPNQPGGAPTPPGAEPTPAGSPAGAGGRR